jgi:hypothetical protein
MLMANEVDDFLLVHLDFCLQNAPAKLRVSVCLDFFNYFVVNFIDLSKLAFLLLQESLKLLLSFIFCFATYCW